MFNSESFEFVKYIRKPDSFFVNFQNDSDDLGNEIISFENATVITNYRPPNMFSSLYDNATMPQQMKNFSNGTLEIKFINGTQIRVITNSTDTRVVYLQKPFASEII